MAHERHEAESALTAHSDPKAITGDPSPLPDDAPDRLILRPAVPEDATEVLDLLWEVFDVGGWLQAKGDSTCMLQTFCSLLQTGWVWVLVLPRDPSSSPSTTPPRSGIIVGSISLAKYRDWGHPAQHLADVWTVVSPQFRSLKAWRMLVSQAEETSENEELPLILGVNCGHDVDRKEMLYLHRGYLKLGGFFLRS